MVSPSAVNLELATDVGPFTVRMTVPIRNLAARLTEGRMSLLLDQDGSVALPDGQVIGYRVATVSPQLRTLATGLELISDVSIEIDQAALRTAITAGARP